MMGGVGQLGGGGAHTIELALGYPPTAARQLQIGDVRGPATTGGERCHEWLVPKRSPWCHVQPHIHTQVELTCLGPTLKGFSQP